MAFYKEAATRTRAERMKHGFLQILLTILLVMDPMGIIPSFLAITSSYDTKTRNRIITKAILLAG
ncbi:MAG: MarC family protein, partial [Treponema sp.]|nr:MarC family protein [Treponema sp.]